MAGASLDHDPLDAVSRATGLDRAVVERGASADELRDAWRELDPPRAAVLRALVGLGGEAPEPRLRAEAADELAAERGEDDPASLREAVTVALDACWEHGLVVARRSDDGRLRALLPQLAEAAAVLAEEDLVRSLERADDSDPSDHGAGRAATDHAVLCAAALLIETPVALTLDGRPYKRGLEAMQERLAPLSPSAAETGDLLDALQGAGLVVTADRELVADVAAIESWTAEDAATRACAFLGNELLQTGNDAMVLLALLREAPAEHLPAPTAARLFRRALVRAGELEEPTDPFGAIAVARERFDLALRELRRAGLAEGESVVAPTARGRAFPDEPEGAAPATVHVQPDLSILVPQGLDPRVHLAIARVSRLEKADVVARYRLDRRIVLDALDHGLEPDELIATLERHASPPLPDSVREDLRRWCERFGEVTAHEGVVVACRIERRRAELDALVERSTLRVHAIAPGVAVVAPEDHEAFHRELVAAGFTPRRQVQRPGGEREDGEAHVAEGLRAGRRLSLPDVLDRTPAWNALTAASTGAALPPRGALLKRLQDKYRRELGSAGVAPLELLDVDELAALEEGGRVRQYLEGLQDAAPRGRAAPDLRDYASDSLVAVASERAGAVLALAAAAGFRCQVAYLVRSGRRSRVVVEPIEVTDDGRSSHALVRLAGNGEERAIPLDRIQALRVLTTGR